MLIEAAENQAPEHDWFWGWPGRKNLIYAYGFLGPVLFFWFALIYGGADFLTGLHSYRVPLDLRLEQAIPFVPAMVLFYHSLHLACLSTPFLLRTRTEMNAVTLVWVLVTFYAGIFFLTIPFEPAYPLPSDDELGRWRLLYQLADDANLRYNSCPSLHVTWGIICIDLFASKAPWFGKLLLWLWGLGMILSTLLLHFHHLADIAAGLVLALLGSRWLYPRLREHLLQSP